MFSFNKRKKQGDASRFLQRVIDLSSPQLVPKEEELRGEKRYGRTLPVLCTPWVDDEPLTSESVLGRTSDLSSRGFGLLVDKPWTGGQMVISILFEGQPHFMLGEIRGASPIGGGLTQVGVEIDSILELGDHPALRELVPVVECLTTGAAPV